MQRREQLADRRGPHQSYPMEGRACLRADRRKVSVRPLICAMLQGSLFPLTASSSMVSPCPRLAREVQGDWFSCCRMINP